MNRDVIMDNIFKSIIWKFTERLAVQGIQFIIQIVLARLLLPEHFGKIIVIMSLITVLSILVQFGFGSALIQKLDITQRDLSSVFYLTQIISFIIYFSLIIFGGRLNFLIEDVLLLEYLKYTSVLVLLSPYNMIQNTLIARNMNFKILFNAGFYSNLISGIISIALAYLGFNIWALIINKLLSQILNIIFIFLKIKWFPSLSFSIESIIELFQFGWKIGFGTFIDTFYQNGKNILIGRGLGVESLGYFNRAEQLPNLIINNINGPIQTVLFPAFSQSQNHRERVLELFTKFLHISLLLVVPVMFILALFAENIVIILFSEKWLPMVPIMQILAISYTFWPIHTLNIQLINSLGKSQLYLKMEIVKKTLEFCLILFTLPHGLIYTSFGILISSVISTLINSFPAQSLIGFGTVKQFKAVLPYYFAIIFPSLIIFLINTLLQMSFSVFIVEIIFILFVYLFILNITKAMGYTYFKYSFLNIIKIGRRYI